MARINRKLTIKELVGNVGRIMYGKPEGEKLPLMRVVGNATGYEPVVTESGTSIKLKGLFKGTNLIDPSKTMTAPNCYLPPAAAELIAGQFTGDVSQVAFAFDIYARVELDSITKYVYEVETIKDPDKDPFTEMEKLLPPLPTTAALPAPDAPSEGEHKSGKHKK